MGRYSGCEYIPEEEWDNIHDSLLEKGMNHNEARMWMNKRFIIKSFEIN